MTQNGNKAFKDALDRFVHIGNVHYNGKHFDNVLNIFNDLDNSDQKSLLTGVYFLFSVMENGVNPVTNVPNTKPKPETLQTEKTVEEKHLTELRIWFIKMLSVFLITGFFVLLMVVIVVGGTSNENSETFVSNVFKILLLMK